jgi:hypothetical protein
LLSTLSEVAAGEMVMVRFSWFYGAAEIRGICIDLSRSSSVARLMRFSANAT